MFRTILTSTLLAGALIVPGASAQPVDHSPHNSSTVSIDNDDRPAMCAMLRDMVDQEQDAASDAYASGHPRRGARFSAAADRDFQEAHDMGCSWAA